MERLIHYVWKYRLYQAETLYTTCGKSIEVLDTGMHNMHAGPDFFNAKIRFNEQVWAGNVEIHNAFSDWYRHRHDQDDAYNSVILHVAVVNDCEEIFTADKRAVPLLLLQIPEKVLQNYEYLLHADTPLPCSSRIHEVPALHLTAWMGVLATERLEAKTQRISDLLEQTKGDWEEVFYITLSRNLGFGVNGDAFERLAKSIPLSYIRKHQDNLFQLEAMLFGQAGLLEETIEDDSYYAGMQKEYRFLKNKFGLKSLEGYLFKRLRIRPYNSPHIKIAQLAAMLHANRHFFSSVLEAGQPDEYYRYFTPPVSDYWHTHYYFGAISVHTEKKLGLSALQIVLINTVVPILFAYAKIKKKDELLDHSIALLERLPPEKNSVVALFAGAGIEVRNALDSQAILQLKREYCERKECLLCRIGYKLLMKARGESQKIM